jgi:hypothetical protein
MIQEKVASNIFRNKDDLLARAFMDLESQVCDLKNMSIITELAVGKMHGTDGEYIDLRLSQDEFNSIQFAVMHLGDMIRKFHDDYYECFHADEEAAAKTQAA